MAGAEADLFSGLSQFEGGFYAQAAGVMWSEEQADAERRLADYAKRNLLIPVEAPMTDRLGARWRLHDQLRRVAGEWLETAPNRTALRQGWGRASLAMMELAGRLYDKHGDAASEGLALLDTELPNIRVAAVDAGKHAASDDVAAEVAMRLPNYSVLDLRLTAQERIDWLEAALPSARRIGDKVAEAKLIRSTAHRHAVLGDLGHAEEMTNEALGLFEDQSRFDLMAGCYSNLGIVNRLRGDLETAETMHLKALELSEMEGLRDIAADQYGNLAILHQMKEEFDQAVEMYRKSLEANEALDRKAGIARQLGNLGIVHQMRDEPDKAEDMYNRALEVNLSLGRSDGVAKQYCNLGLLHRSTGQSNLAEEMYERALEIEQQRGSREGMARNLSNLSALLLDRGCAAQALQHAETALALYREVGMAPEIAQTEELVSKIRESM